MYTAIGIIYFILFLWYFPNIMASTKVICRGSNREDKFWAYCWDNRSWVRPITIAWAWITIIVTIILLIVILKLP